MIAGKCVAGWLTTNEIAAISKRVAACFQRVFSAAQSPSEAPSTHSGYQRAVTSQDGLAEEQAADESCLGASNSNAPQQADTSNCMIYGFFFFALDSCR